MDFLQHKNVLLSAINVVEWPCGQRRLHCRQSLYTTVLKAVSCTVRTIKFVFQFCLFVIGMRGKYCFHVIQSWPTSTVISVAWLPRCSICDCSCHNSTCCRTIRVRSIYWRQNIQSFCWTTGTFYDFGQFASSCNAVNSIMECVSILSRCFGCVYCTDVCRVISCRIWIFVVGVSAIGNYVVILADEI